MLKEVQAKLPAMVAMLGEIVEMESPSDDKAHLDRLIERLDVLAQQRGGDTHIIELPPVLTSTVADGGKDTAALSAVLCFVLIPCTVTSVSASSPIERNNSAASS